MDILGRKKTKVGTCNRDEKPSLVRVACALRRMLDDVIQGVGESPGIRNLLEYAAQNMFLEGVPSGEPGIERKVVDTAEIVTTCAHSCPDHAELMDIALWSELPEELQELVFARLPWPQIYGVRILSKGWNQKLMSGAKDSQSQLNRACARAQPKLFALLEPEVGPGSFIVNVFDIASNRWHTFETSSGYDPKCGKIKIGFVSASDGGLVCLLSIVPSWSKETPRLVFVCNPLTRVWKQLPPLYGKVQEEIMVQLIMDRETKHYRVIVVDFSRGSEVRNLIQAYRSEVNVYHSQTGQWTQADGSSSGEMVYGYVYSNNLKCINTALCCYNFADGLVHEIANFGDYAHGWVLLKDHLFRLKDVEPAGGLPTQCIEEHLAVHCGASWKYLKEYPLTPQRIEPDDISWFRYIFACKDFLLLYAFHEENRRELFFLYEFFVEEWRELPLMPDIDLFFAEMCELRFDSVP